MDDRFALSALETLSRCGWYARWLYELAEPYLGRRVVEAGAGLGTQSEVMLDAPGSELREFLLTETDPGRVSRLEQRFASRSNVRTAAWTLPDPFPFPEAQGFGSRSGQLHGPDDAARPGQQHGPRPDTFVCWNVLEHVRDDTWALTEMARALEPGGRVVVLCPAGPGLFGPLDGRFGHFRRYARRELSRKARAAGLDPVVERRVNLVGAVGWLVTTMLFARRNLPDGGSRLFDLLVPLLRLWEDRLPVPWGLSVLLVAVKK